MRKNQSIQRWLTKEQEELHRKEWKVIELIEEFVTSSDFKFIRETEFPLPDKASAIEIAKYEYPLDYLLNRHPEEAKVVVYKQIIFGMIIDFCYFIQEAYSCAKIGRISVTYSLLRRPLVYNLVILLRMIYDENFYEKFTKDSSYDPTVYKPEDLKIMLKEFDKVKLMSPINDEIIYSLIFDKDNPSSIINLSNRAIHPTTTRNWNKTGELNFNFIFAVRSDIESLLDTFYRNMLTILAFYFELFSLIVLPYAPQDRAASLLNSQYTKFINIMS